MEGVDMDTTQEPVTDVKTFRGRSLEEILPQIRAELGADAIVVRRREGLAGGVGGFFQRSYVEVDARPAHDDEKPLEARNDRATAEGLASPAIRALVDQAAPFADALASAQGSASERAHEVLIAAAQGAASAGLYGPQPNHEAIAEAAPVYTPMPVEAPAARAIEMREGLGAERPNVADAHEQRLVAAGLSAGLAQDVVAEAVAHGLPFAQPRSIKKLIRTALARRMPVMSDLGGDTRTIAFVGAGGPGKSSATERPPPAHAGADAQVVGGALPRQERGPGASRRRLGGGRRGGGGRRPARRRRRRGPLRPPRAAPRERHRRRRRRAGRPPARPPPGRADDRRRALGRPGRP